MSKARLQLNVVLETTIDAYQTLQYLLFDVFFDAGYDQPDFVEFDVQTLIISIEGE